MRALLLLMPAAIAAPAAVEFNRDIRPILSDRCFVCHGPDAANRKANLRLDQESFARPKLAEALRRVTTDNKALRMPPAYAGHDRLPESQIATLKQWIDQGAPWQKHWSFLPVERPPVSAVQRTGWTRNPIDHFVLSRLESLGLKPSAEASRTTLLRRVSLDLTGLPPSITELDEVLRDDSPQAYTKAVDRLLASPRYAERMAIRWLEAARYADTNGYQSDGVRDMWRWRDWVISAFHRNMPFDRFTIEQIGGDLLPNATLDQRIATAFHRNHRTSAEGGIVEEEFRVEYVADRVETTATVWLGLTMGCSRCHDHKYDPLTQRDFYSLFAFYNNTPDRGLVFNFGNEEPFIKAPTPDHARQLAERTERVHHAERQWAVQARTAAEGQRRWEKEARSGQPLDWSFNRGLVLHLKEPFDGSRPLEAGFDAAKFDYTDPFTLSAWITPKSPNGTIVSRAQDYWEGEGYTWFLHEGKLRLHTTRRFTDISLRIETAEPIEMNKRQHVAITYDGYRKGAGVRMYVNGVSRELKIDFDELTYPYGPKEPFRVGVGAGEKYRFQGLITDVRAYNHALRADEVQSLTEESPVHTIASIPARKRTEAQQAKLRLCYIEKFAPAPVRDALAAAVQARKEWRKTYDSLPTVMVMRELPARRDAFILKRGAYDAPGDKVEARVPAALPPLKPDWPANRLGLARWLVDRSNPLTARVTVNRYWQMLFGTGIVKTGEDFGAQGEWPTNQPLLDWLAAEFMESGWDVKHILKTIVTSAAYRQSSAVTPELLNRDPENRLVARGPRFRLSHEMVRDQALAVSGLLVEKTGGPSVKPYQPPGLWQELSGGRYNPDKGEGLYRRTLYTYWRRTIAPPSMITFDSPTRETCMVRETRTNTPLQALNLMNDVAYLEAARKLAERMIREGGSDRLGYGFRLAAARTPDAEERSILARTLDRFQTRFAGDPAAAAKYLEQGESPRASGDPVELAAYTSVASMLLNLDETVTKE